MTDTHTADAPLELTDAELDYVTGGGNPGSSVGLGLGTAAIATAGSVALPTMPTLPSQAAITTPGQGTNTH